MIGSGPSGFITILVGMACIIGYTYGVAVMSVDVGSEWMKVAIVSVSIDKIVIHLLLLLYIFIKCLDVL